jgi:pyrroline-5-carboxylate reductase
MGSALLAGWLDRGIPPNTISVIEPDADRRAALASTTGLVVGGGPGDLASGLRPEVVVVAVKPQVVESAVPVFAGYGGNGAVFLSIVAGRSLASFRRLLGSATAVVRAMPNTPAAVGQGMSVACANDRVNGAQRQACTRLLAAVGEVAWIDDESLLDAVTAVSGSGPAYVFLLAEALAAAGTAAGLPADLADRLARQTVIGAGELLRRCEDRPETLRRNVTSPGGTTEAALEVLLAPRGFGWLLARAVKRAARRSRQLAD